MLTIHADTTQLREVMREFSRVSRRSLDDVIRQQAGVITGYMIALTPPAASRGQALSARGGVSNSAKKRGESRVAADIAALFPTTKMREGKIDGMIDAGFEFGTGRGRKKITQFAATEADLVRIHQAARSKSTGRTRTGSTGQNMALTRSGIRSAYIKSMQKQVGKLSAGWLRAAKELRTAKRNTPAWITRHGSKPGGVSFARMPGGLTVTMENRMPYFPRDMESRLNIATRLGTQGLRKGIAAMLEREAKKANARMARRGR